MDFAPSARATEMLERLQAFMAEQVFPAEPVYAEQRRAVAADGRPHELPPVVEELKAEARTRGLWNLFLPEVSGLSLLDYAPLAELSGWSTELAPEAMNCAAPDTGNMEVLHLVGTDEQKQQWLEPLLDGQIRSGFAMTEPDVASSDARNIATSIRRDGDEYVINGRKWWTTGAADPRCAVLIVMGRTDPDARRLPAAVDGAGADGRAGRDAGAVAAGVRLPRPARPRRDRLRRRAGAGRATCSARRAAGSRSRRPGSARAGSTTACGLVGMAERALELMVRRAPTSREAFGRPLAGHGVVAAQIAEARMAIEQARLLVLKTAWLIDTVGVQAAASEVAAIKVVVPRMACKVIDDAIQVHGGAGVSDDVPLAAMYAARAHPADRRRPGRGARPVSGPRRARPALTA